MATASLDRSEPKWQGVPDRALHAAAELWSASGIAESFHEPYPSNFVLMFVPRNVDFRRYIERIGRSMFPLNLADKALCNFCDLFDRDHAPVGLRPHIDEWLASIRSGTNLLNIRHAVAAFRVIEASGLLDVGVAKHLSSTRPEIVGRFLTLPESVINTLRINSYLKRCDLRPCLEHLAGLMRDPTIEACIDRIEVAKDLHADSDREPTYPRLILYLRWHSLEALSDALRKLAPCLERKPYSDPRALFAARWGSASTVTQGFTLLKTYLALLGRLDDVYSPTSAFAFTRASEVELLELIETTQVPRQAH